MKHWDERRKFWSAESIFLIYAKLFPYAISDSESQTPLLRFFLRVGGSVNRLKNVPSTSLHAHLVCNWDHHASILLLGTEWPYIKLLSLEKGSRELLRPEKPSDTCHVCILCTQIGTSNTCSTPHRLHTVHKIFCYKAGSLFEIPTASHKILLL